MVPKGAIMKITQKDLRSPSQCFPDNCEKVTLTRGDITLLNQIIGVLNQIAKDERYFQHAANISMILESERISPGSAPLLFNIPKMYQKHIMEFSDQMAEKQADYYGRHPEQKPLNPMNRFMTKTEIKKYIESEGGTDAHQDVESAEESETQQSVDAKSTQHVEQDHVGSNEV